MICAVRRERKRGRERESERESVRERERESDRDGRDEWIKMGCYKCQRRVSIQPIQ